MSYHTLTGTFVDRSVSMVYTLVRSDLSAGQTMDCAIGSKLERAV